MTSLLGRMLGFVVLATLLTCMAACSSGSEKGAQKAGENPQREPGHRETTVALARAATRGGGTAATPNSRAVWDYVALGDSLAAGVGAERGYVDRYAEHLRNDTGAGVRVVNLGVSGQTSAELLHALLVEVGDGAQNGPDARGHPVPSAKG